ncbi:hypothetical protein EJ07DRAFT_180885 [Lizonia empirigonia]|nr:hypothetical protein EJ07DRAFT_180885 [Lizonia empirigonia]
MNTSSADKRTALTKIPHEIILHILSFLDRATIFQLTYVCQHFKTFVQPNTLYCAWNTIRQWETWEDDVKLPQLDLLPRSLLFDVCFRVFGSDNYRTQLLLQTGVDFQTAPQVFGKLLGDTFRKLGDGHDTQLLQQNGADFTQVPCGLHKLLEDTFRKLGDGHGTQLLQQNGADFTQVPCGLHKLLEDTFRKLGDGHGTQLLRQSGIVT